MLVGTVSHKFKVPHRGTVIGLDRGYDQIADDLKLNVGDTIELRHEGASVLRAKILGMPVSMPLVPNAQVPQGICLRLPADIEVEAIPIGAEVWTLD